MHPSTRRGGFPSQPQREPPPVPPHARPILNSARPPRNNDSRGISRKPLPEPPASSSSLPDHDSGLVDASHIPADLVPTLPPMQRPPPPQKSAHGRSMSHPFPSLFPKRRGAQGKPAAQDDFDSDSDSDAEMLGLGPGSKTHKSKASVQASGPPYPRPQLGEKDYASGSCMTCGSPSRWPKGLKVFKCTLCVTINDLVDLKGTIESQYQAFGGRHNGTPQDGAPSGSRGEYSKAMPVAHIDLRIFY